ncbi:MAG TPA: hypothetical protein VJQ51_05565 [Burkholderiales bacterium]|nr:hypothetical protein [Burkholderiales bacterium]
MDFEYERRQSFRKETERPQPEVLRRAENRAREPGKPDVPEQHRRMLTAR